MNQAPQQQLNLTKYKSIWSRRKWVAIVVVMIGMPVAGLVWFIVPATYQAVAWLDLGSTEAEKDVRGPSARVDQTKEAARKFDEAEASLTSRGMIRALIQGTDDEPPVKGLAGDIDVKDEVQVDKLYRLIRKRIDVRTVGAEILQVSYSHRVPEVAKSFVDGLILKLKAERTAKIQKEYKFPYDRRKKDVDNVRDGLKLQKQKLEEFRNRHATDLAKGDLSALGNRLTEVRNQLMEINWDLKAGEQELEFLKVELQRIEEATTMRGSTLLIIKQRKLNEAIADLEIRRIVMGKKYTDEHPVMGVIEDQIAALREERKNTEGKEAEPTDEALPDNPIYLEYRRRAKECELENQRLEGERASKEKEEQALRENIKNLPGILKDESVIVDKIEEWQKQLTAAIRAEGEAKGRHELAQTDSIDAFKRGPAYVLAVGNTTTKMMLTGVVGAVTIAAALLLMWLAEQFKPSLVLVDDARELLSIPSLGIVPVIETPGDARRRKMRKAFAGLAIAIELAALCLVFSVFREKVGDWVDASWVGSIAGDILMRLGI